MNDMSLDKDNTLIIEDSKTGLISAVKSLARVIGITTSLSREQILEIDDGIYVAESYKDVGEYLQNS